MTAVPATFERMAPRVIDDLGVASDRYFLSEEVNKHLGAAKRTRFRRFRNREMAHAAMGRDERSHIPANFEDWPRLHRERLLRDYPSFGDLERAIGLADDMRRNLSFLAWGVVVNPAAERVAIRRSCRPVLDVIVASSRTDR